MKGKKTTQAENLAINGGPKRRSRPLPYRKLFGEAELRMVHDVFEHSWKKGVDFGYQGDFEDRYLQSFCGFQGGGFADAVCTGTAAVYVAVQSLGLEPGSEIIVSPVTDPGSVAPIILAGMRPVVSDSGADTFNIDAENFQRACSDRTQAAVLSHIGGNPIDIGPIMTEARSRGIKIIEDCSQAHGALYNGKRVGCFGDIAVFSTMFSKQHATGGCGGVVYTQSKDYYHKIRSVSDRGKPFDKPDFDPKNPNQCLFPALNLNLDEISSAIGISTLSRLQKTIERRIEIINQIDTLLEQKSRATHPLRRLPACVPSPFFHSVGVNLQRLETSKLEFAQAVAAEGITLNPHYRYVVSEWTWLQPHLSRPSATPNAKAFRDRTFQILFNERFSNEDVADIVDCIVKVESVLAKHD